MRKLNLLLLLLLLSSSALFAQADFYSIQPLGHRYLYNSDYFEDARDIQVYQNGVIGDLSADSVLTVYIMDAQYPPTYNLFCSTFDLLYPNVPCIIVGIVNFNRQSDLTPPYTDSLSVRYYDHPGHAKEMLSSLKEELIPFITKKYHAGSRRILVGHSLGGTFVTYAMMEDPAMFPCILAVSPNYEYSKSMMVHKMEHFSIPNSDVDKVYIYLANGKKDKIEEKFKPYTKEAVAAFRKQTGVILHYDSLDIEKHSFTVFEGFYKGLQSLKPYIEKSVSR